MTTVSQRPTGELTSQLGYLLKCFIRWLPALWSAFLTLVTFESRALFLPRSFNKERVSLPTDTRNTVLQGTGDAAMPTLWAVATELPSCFLQGTLRVAE